MKTCNHCKLEKPLSEFHYSSYSKDGLQYKCKNCIRDINREKAKKNKEKNLLIGDSIYEEDRLKKCTKCNTDKSIKEFDRHISTKDGLQCHCRECSRDSNLAYRLSNPEKEKDRYKIYKLNNPDKIKANSKIQYLANIDKIKIRDAARYAANPEKHRARSSEYKANHPEILIEWLKKNPDARRTYSHNRRARQRANGGVLSKGLREKLFKLQRGCCAICKKKLPKLTRQQHLDHIIAVLLGGANEDWNMQLLCETCNKKKAAKDNIKHMQSLGYLL